MIRTTFQASPTRCIPEMIRPDICVIGAGAELYSAVFGAAFDPAAWKPLYHHGTS